MTPLYIYYKARIFSYTVMLHVKVLCKTITIKICNTKFRENIFLKITQPDVHLLKYVG